MSKAALSLIQTGLRDLGYNPGPVDGLYGPRTDAAALAWLDARGRPAASALTPQTSSVIYQGAARHPVRELIIHCSATRPDWMEGAGLAAKRAEIRRWHLANGWSEIGYHWLIDRDGKVLAGRAEGVIGAHVVGRNAGTLGLCLIGGHGSAETDRFADHFTAAQDVTLRQLLQGIGMRTRIERISGHNEFAAKACPGFNVTQWLSEAA